MKKHLTFPVKGALLGASAAILVFLATPAAEAAPVIDYDFEDGATTGWNVNPAPTTPLAVVNDPVRSENKVLKVDDSADVAMNSLATTPAFSPGLNSGIYEFSFEIMVANTGGAGTDYFFDRRIALMDGGTIGTYARLRYVSGDSTYRFSGFDGGSTHVDGPNIAFNTWYKFTQITNIDTQTWSYQITNVATNIILYTSDSFDYYSNVATEIDSFWYSTVTFNPAPGSRGGLVYFDNVKIEQIPEPGAAMLLLFAGQICLLARRRNNQSLA